MVVSCTTVIVLLYSARYLKILNPAGWLAVLDVALNPAVLQKRKDDKADINDIYKLALSFAQQQHRMLLSAEYSIVSCSPNSNRDDLRCRLGVQKPPTSKLETGK